MAEPSPGFLSDLAELLTKVAARDAVLEAHLVKTVLPSAPGQALAGLAALASNLSDEPLRILCLLLIKRLAPSTLERADPTALEQHGKQIWDLLSDAERDLVNNKLLQRMQHAQSLKESERSVLCAAIASIEGLCEQRGYRWEGLRRTLEALHTADMLAYREIAFTVYAECPSILADTAVQSVIHVFKTGLSDESAGVRIAALSAAVNLLLSSDTPRVKALAFLAQPMLNLIQHFSESRSTERLCETLIELINLASSRAVATVLLKSHLPKLAPLLVSLVKRSNNFDEPVRCSAIELIVSLFESLRVTTKKATELVHECTHVLLETTAEVDEDAEWNASTDINDTDEEAISVVAEQALERLAHAAPAAVWHSYSKLAFSLLTHDHWQARHGALSTLGAISSGCQEQMLGQLDKVVNAALQMVNDPHPRVRNAAVFALSQLCSDLDGAVQEQFAVQVMQALIVVMHDPIPRLQGFAAAACVNFLDLADLQSHPEASKTVDELFTALVTLTERGQLFVKENAIQAISLLADVYEERFATFYPRVMPLLLSVLETEQDTRFQSLLAKALDCAATMGAAVPHDTFAPDAPRLLAIMKQMQATLTEEDEETRRALLGAYASLAQAIGPAHFGPYLVEVLPQMLEAAERQPDIVMGAVGDEYDDEDEWDKIETDNGGSFAVRAGELQAKAEAVSNLVVLVKAMRENMGVEALVRVLDVAIPLLKFYFFIEVREYAAALVDIAIEALAKITLDDSRCSKAADATLETVTDCVAQDTDAEVLATFVSCWTNVAHHVPSHVSETVTARYLAALDAQLVARFEGPLANAEPSEEWEDEDDEAEERQDRQETDTTLLMTINMSLKALMQSCDTAFPISAFAKYMRYVAEPAGDPVKIAFAQRLVADVLEIYKEGGVSIVQAFLTPTLANFQASQDLEVQRSAAHVIASAARFAPNALNDFIRQAIPPLLEVVRTQEQGDEATASEMASDAALIALARVFMAVPDTDVSHVAAWVEHMPLRFPQADAEAPYALFVQLLSSSHPVVSATKARHLVDVLVAGLGDDTGLLPDLQKALASALKAYGGQVRGVDIPESVQHKIMNL